MVLWLAEDEVETALSNNVAELITALESLYLGNQVWESSPRVRLISPNSSFQYMGATVPGQNIMGLKAYAVGRGSGMEGTVMLYESDRAELISVMSCDFLGRWRTGAVSALVAKHFSPQKEISLGLIGTGKQAFTQLGAMASLGQLVSVRAYSPNQERCKKFSQKASEKFGIEVVAAQSAQSVAENSNVISTVTPAKEIVLQGSWLQAPCLINAVGANRADQQELEPEILRSAELIIVDDYQQARLECGDLIKAVELGVVSWDQVVSLKAALTHLTSNGKDGLTVFESQGLAVWDLVAANIAYSKCMEMGLGTKVNLRGVGSP